jgi:hypothetical protein
MKCSVFLMAFTLVGCADREHARMIAEKARDAAIADYYSGKAFVARDGTKEAQTDIARNAPKVYLYGRIGADIDYRTAILKQRFGVVIDPLAGCIVSEPLVRFADDYNAEVRTFIAERFGPMAFEDAEKEAFARWKAKRKNG